jgi:hypothetical protein
MFSGRFVEDHPYVATISEGFHLVHPECTTRLSDDVLFIGTRFSNLYTAVDTPAEAASVP